MKETTAVKIDRIPTYIALKEKKLAMEKERHGKSVSMNEVILSLLRGDHI